ncbi:MAG: YajQ family cyclic di-GMP-binding protein [Verrucomicrobiota bacterium]
MASFDVVSEVDMQEVDNAVNQARKKIANRFDFREAGAEIAVEATALKLQAVDKFKLDALVEVVMSELARRGVSLKNIERQDPDISPLGHARLVLTIHQGIEGEEGKAICAAVRALKLKVTAQIQGNQVRVTGGKRDDLQKVITHLRAGKWKRALAFTNYRS